MDKINRALSGVEENSALIRSLDYSLRALVKKTFRVTVVSGKNGTVNGASGTVFGKATADGECAAIVRFDGSSASLVFNGAKLATSASPMFVKLPEGKGVLGLSAQRSNAVCMIIGCASVS